MISARSLTLSHRSLRAGDWERSGRAQVTYKAKIRSVIVKRLDVRRRYFIALLVMFVFGISRIISRLDATMSTVMVLLESLCLREAVTTESSVVIQECPPNACAIYRLQIQCGHAIVDNLKAKKPLFHIFLLENKNLYDGFWLFLLATDGDILAVEGLFSNAGRFWANGERQPFFSHIGFCCSDQRNVEHWFFSACQ